MQLHSFRVHSGVDLTEKPVDFLRPTLLGNVVTHNFVTNERRRSALNSHISDYFWHRRMMNGFSMRAGAAKILNPNYNRGFMSGSGKVLLNGAGGDRVRGFVRRKLEFSDESLEFFRRIYDARVDPSVWRKPAEIPDTCWIDVKNFYNFFHFLTESFHQAFTSSKAIKSSSKIVFRSSSARMGVFADKWIDDCRDALMKDISVVAGRQGEEYLPDAVTMPISAKHLLYQFTGIHDQLIQTTRPPGRTWTGYDSTPHPVMILGLNSFDDSLLEFRNAVIALAKSKINRTWSRKIYVRRTENLARARVMTGEDLLVSKLEKRGFETVYFEDLSPLEQVKCANDARCVVMQHGAGMANMVFANNKAHFFELGTYQTGMARWSDFIPLSHVSQCHYHHIFLDMDFAAEDVDPVFKKDGLVAPRISGEDVDRILEAIKVGMVDKSSGAIAGLVAHTAYFRGRQAYRQAYRLLDASASLAGDDGEYWRARAQVDKACGHLRAANDHFEYAKKLDARRSGKESPF